MPTVSRKQFRFMKAVESGKVKAPGLSKEEAREFAANVKPSGLPERARPRKKK